MAGGGLFVDSGIRGIRLNEEAPDHTTISRTRRLIDVEAHQQVFAWVLERLAEAGLVKGKRIGIDATALESCSRCDRYHSSP